MSRWYLHDESKAIEAAAKEFRSALDTYQPTNNTGGPTKRDQDAAKDAEVFVERVEMALRGTDWRRVEAFKAEQAAS